MAKVLAQLKPWQKKALIISASTLVVLTVLWALIPTFTKYFANRFLNQYDAELTAESINPDLFPIGLSLSNIAITQQNQPTLSLDQFSVGLDFWPLFTGTFQVNHILLDGFAMQVRQDAEGWVVAGVPTYSTEPTEEASSTEEETEEGGAPPTFFIRNASIQDTSVNLITENGEDTFAIANLDITEVSHELANWRGIFELEADINNGKAILEGDIRADKEQVNADVNLGNVQLSSSDVVHFLPAGLGELTAKDLRLEGNTRTTYRFSEKPMLSFTSPLITLDSQAFSLEQKAQTINWQTMKTGLADVSIDLQDTRSLQAQANNSLQIEGLTIVSGENRIDMGELSLKNDVALNKTGNTLRVDKANTQLTFENSNLQSGANNIQLSHFDTKIDDASANLSLEDFTGKVAANLNLKANTFVGQLESGENFDLKSLSLSTPTEATLNSDNKAINLSGLALALENGQLSGNELSAQLEKLNLDLGKTQVNQSSESLGVTNDSITLNLIQAAFKNAQVDAQSGDLAVTLSNNSVAQTQSSLNITGQSEVNSSNVKATLRQLPNDQPETTVSYNNLALNSQITWQQTAEKSTLDAQKNGLTLSDLGLQQKETLTSLLQSLNLNSENLHLDLNQNGLEDALSQNNQLQLGNFSATLPDGSALANWKSIKVNSSSVAMDPDGPQATVENVTVDQFLASKPNSERNLPSLAEFEKLAINNIQLKPEGVEIDDVSIDKLVSGIALGEDRSIANLVLPNSLQTKESQEEATASTDTQAKQVNETPQDKAPAFYAVVHRVTLSPESQFSFTDRGIKPALSRVLDIEQLTVENINTKSPEEQTRLVLKAKNGDYATIDSELTITPLAERLTMEVQATIREVELPPVSPYVSSALGYQINSGQLNLDLNLKSTQGELDGSSHIVLRQFDLGGQKDGNAVLKVGAIPLNLAVDTLKNRDDNIVLDLPMKGDISNPNFQWENFFLLPIRQGLFKASSTYLMQTFVPYANVITLVQFAGEQALRLRVEPLQYALDEPDITAPEQEAYLDQMIKLMKDRKGTELKACGVSVVKDISEEKTYKSLTEGEKGELLELANQRAESLKRYLVDNGIKSSRVFLCAPSIDDDNNAAPHVTFTF